MKHLWIDTETTGLDINKHEIIQIAGILEEPGVRGEEFNFNIKPMFPENADPQALEIHGISLETMETFQNPHDVYLKLKDLLFKWVNPYNPMDKLILSGQNVKFDSDFMNTFFKKNNNKYWYALVTTGSFDLRSLSVMYEVFHNKRIFKNYKLETICNELGVTLDKAHDAMSDIKATRICSLLIWNKIIK